MIHLALAPALLAAAIAAQEVQVPDAQAPAVVPGSYVVIFSERSFDLEGLRQAIYGRQPSHVIDAIVRDLAEAAVRDQAPFTRAVEALGGQVVSHYWLINGACVTGIADDRVPALRALPNVVEVHPNRVWWTWNNTARNSTHHEADQANQRRTASNAPVTGTGVSVAVLDTGIDRLYQSTGNPNPAFYIGGSQSNTQGGGIGGSRVKSLHGVPSLGNITEDGHGHGTHVSGSIASDASAFRGMAPGAWLVSVKVADNAGFGNTNTLVEGWQRAVAQRAADNVLVANNSMAGSPSLTEPAQMALDSAAYNGDILCVVASGNSGSNTTNSQNAWNGIAVGAIIKNTLSVANFSGRGPLANFGRTYPDITAVGVSVRSSYIDTPNGAISDGTSMASPMVAGAGACVRQVDSRMTAREAKALLLARTKHVQTSRNTYGLGVLDIDAAVEAALAHDYGEGRVTNAAPVWRRTFTVTNPGTHPICITWMHPPGSTIDNLDLRIRDANNNVVASDLNTLNSYEKVNLVVLSPGTFTAEVTWVNPTTARNVDFAISGIGSLLPTQPPQLTNINPGTVANPTPPLITLDGTNLEQLDKITVGGVDITTFNVVSPTQVTFNLPVPFVIGQHNVTATNAAGTSNALQLRVDGAHPMQLTSPPFSARGFPTDISGIGDRNWITVLFTSTSSVPSNLPGIVSMNMGNNFAELFQLVVLSHDNRGFWSVQFTIPTSIPSGTGLFFQAVTIDPANPVPPIEASNRTQTVFF